MRRLAFCLFFLTLFSSPSSIFAQQHPANATSSPAPLAGVVPDAAARVREAALLREKWRRPCIYESAKKHPLTPHDVALRDAVQKLGVDPHRFVRCELRNGSKLTGGILSIGQEEFSVSQGIMGQTRIA
jgi:hypothetical protein